MGFGSTESAQRRGILSPCSITNFCDKLYSLALCRISIAIIKAIDNHGLASHTYILPCEFQKQCDKLMKLDVKPFAEQGTIVLDPWVYYPSALADFRNELMSDCCENRVGSSML